MPPKNSTRVDNIPRVMWLLNHTSARKFEVPLLRQLGYEVFTPKIYPNDANFRSASVDYQEDINLTIPPEALKILNNANWYEGADNKAWEVANAYFDMAFFIIFNPRGVEKICRRFNGELLWRTYGLAGNNTYSGVLTSHHVYITVKTAFKKLGSRFWFAEAYSNLHEIEDQWLQSKAVFLPLGMSGAEIADTTMWAGGDKRILFICPDIGFNIPYTEIYNEFKKEFKGFPYSIGGTQSVFVDDPNVMGYLPLEKHQKNMRHMQLMFYHSREPRHIHYHPFEAVRAGMPLIFMAGGMLDRMGGKSLPGRARTWDEARNKVRRLLDGDEQFIEAVRQSQGVLLEGMKVENLRHHWKIGLHKVMDFSATRQRLPTTRQQRVAVLTNYKNLDRALQVARDIERQSREANEALKVILGVEEPQISLRKKGKLIKKNKSLVASQTINNIEDLSVRIFNWNGIAPDQAERALTYANAESPLPNENIVVPDDQINFFQDCDLWVIVGGRIDNLILPLKPILPVITEDFATYSKPKTDDIYLAKMGFILRVDAMVVSSEEARSHLVLTEGVDPTIVYVIDENFNGASILEVVMECL